MAPRPYGAMHRGGGGEPEAGVRPCRLHACEPARGDHTRSTERARGLGEETASPPTLPAAARLACCSYPPPAARSRRPASHGTGRERWPIEIRKFLGTAMASAACSVLDDPPQQCSPSSLDPSHRRVIVSRQIKVAIIRGACMLSRPTSDKISRLG
ncbi:hypothetical protein BS78_10G248400 [Paspalum vaginatum]|nr:hypothetical protein BS78_10G248400 [Paspalum vaginatum]